LDHLRNWLTAVCEATVCAPSLQAGNLTALLASLHHQGVKHTLLLMDPVRCFKGPRARAVRRKGKEDDDPTGREGVVWGWTQPLKSGEYAVSEVGAKTTVP